MEAYKLRFNSSIANGCAWFIKVVTIALFYWALSNIQCVN